MRLGRRKVVILTGPRRGSLHMMQGHRGEHPVRRQKMGAGEGPGQSFYWGLLRKGKARQGKQFRID